MQEIIIDEEFKALLPALDEDTYAMLEENLLQNGCRDSIVLWGDILIDGHNRYEICSKHDIEFNTIGRDFASREEALIWIISTQVSRRNLTQIQLSHFRGLHYMADKRMLGGDQKSKRHNDVSINDQIGSTSKRLARQYKVSPRTIDRDAKAAAAIEAIGEVSPAAKKMILSGEVAIDKVKLRELSECPREELKAVATAIEKGTYEKQPPASSAPPTSSNPASPAGAVLAVLAEIHHLQLAIDNLKASLSAMAEIKKAPDRSEIMKALQSCIDQLEGLYKKIS